MASCPARITSSRRTPAPTGTAWRPEAQRRGWRCELIGAKSFGSLAENAAVLRQWLADHRDERVVLVSLSKGGAKVKWALHEPHAAETFQNVSAWINVSGILNGSPLVRWLLDRPWRALLADAILVSRPPVLGAP